jgi:hypothetical protein
MPAVGGVHAMAVQVAVASVKQEPVIPVGVTVILTLSPPAKLDNWKDKTLPMFPTLTVEPVFTW